jgi:hypothetical protein
MTHRPPTVFDEYNHCVEVVPGVFIDNEDPENVAIYIVDRNGEVVCWTHSEFLEDGYAITAALFAVALATAKGASAVRQNLDNAGETMDALVEETSKT